MLKKMLKATLVLATLLFFVSCQEQKEMKKTDGKKSSEKMMKKKSPNKPTSINLENPKDKCCVNEDTNVPKDENMVTPKTDETMAKPMQDQTNPPVPPSDEANPPAPSCGAPQPQIEQQ